MKTFWIPWNKQMRLPRYVRFTYKGGTSIILSWHSQNLSELKLHLSTYFFQPFPDVPFLFYDSLCYFLHLVLSCDAFYLIRCRSSQQKLPHKVTLKKKLENSILTNFFLTK